MLPAFDLRGEKFKFTIKQLIALVVANIIGVVIGSKLLFFIVGLPEWIRDFSFKLMIEKIATSGFVFYGGLTCGYGAASSCWNCTVGPFCDGCASAF